MTTDYADTVIEQVRHAVGAADGEDTLSAVMYAMSERQRWAQECDQWRQRVAALEDAMREADQAINGEDRDYVVVGTAEIITQALAVPAPQLCPGYVPTGHVCERCGQSPQDHPASPAVVHEEASA